VVAALLVAVTAPAGAAVNIAFSKLGPGYGDVVVVGGTPRDAGSILFTIDGEEVTTYCVEVDKPFNESAVFTAAPAATSGITDIGKAGWVAKNAPTTGTPLGNADAEQSAIQIAVWHFTDGVVVDAASVGDPVTRDRALELIAAVGSNSLASTPANYSLTLTPGIDGSVATFTATLTSDGGAPVPSTNVRFSSGDIVSDVTTDANGVAVGTFPAPAAGASVEASATASTTLAAGTVLVPEDGSQRVVLAEDVTSSVSAVTTATAPAAPAPPAEPAPSTSAPAAAPPAEELPYTGGTLGLPHLLLAGGLLSIGVYAAIRLRRNQANI
jgi:hypothetical protein